MFLRQVLYPLSISPSQDAYFLMANTVSPIVVFRSLNCSFSVSMSKVPSQMMGASQGVRTRTSVLLHGESHREDVTKHACRNLSQIPHPQLPPRLVTHPEWGYANQAAAILTIPNLSHKGHWVYHHHISLHSLEKSLMTETENKEQEPKCERRDR